MKLRLLSTVLTIGSVALAASLVIAVQILERETERNYTQTSVGYDLILAAPGSRMQTTLNTIYHLETSTGVIPYGVFEAASRDPRIAKAFPFFVGDNYRGVRIIGTNQQFIDSAEPRAGVQFELAEGRNFSAPFEAVIGSAAARRLGIEVGHKFYMTHGVSETGGGAEAHIHDEHELVIVGILEQSRTANDNVIFTSVYSTYVVHYHDHDHDHDHNHDDHDHNGHSHGNNAVHEHEHEHEHEHGHNHDHDHNGSHSHDDHHHSEHDDDDEHHHHGSHSVTLSELESRVTAIDAVLLRFNNQAAAIQLAGLINFPVPDNPLFRQNAMRDPFFQYKDDLMAVIPATQIQELMGIVGNAEQVLRAIGWLVFIVALLGVLVALYNTMEERRRDIAIMRSLGASRSNILTYILLESALITGIGCIIGLLLGLGIVGFSAPQIAELAGIVIDSYQIEATQITTIAIFTGLGILSGIIPALKAYNTDVATNLAP
ncbi:MAG: ABC transporter permease [Balneolales bacterium]|nr:ABC transporter permease [Balneolales bacterium]